MAGTTVGIQGGSASAPCLFCNVPSCDWAKTDTIPVSNLRTVGRLFAAGEAVERAENELTQRQLAVFKRQQQSVNATPLILEIPIHRYVPPVVHICISAVNSIIKYCKDKGDAKKYGLCLNSVLI